MNFNKLTQVLSRNSFNIASRMLSSTEKPTVIVEQIGAVTTIGINRPEKRNCVDSKTAQLLRNAISNFENDDKSLVGVLYGLGGNFCAGYDLGELASFEANLEDSVNVIQEDGTMGPTQRYIKKPMIAAVSGYAVAGGLELSLMCDLRVMEENAIMGVYCRRFGVPLIDGGTVRLSAIVGLSRALDLILTGRSIEAKEAHEWGLANRVVACGTALGQAITLASSLTKFPQACMLADRQSAYNATFSSMYNDLFKYERENGAKVIIEESIPGAKKFVSGTGRHGKSYNLTEKPISDWEKKENENLTSKL